MSTDNSELEADGACASFGTNRDRDLFTLPDSSHLGECPICFLPLPLEGPKSTLMRCCCKIICNGCHIANQKRENEEGLKHKCALCRQPVPKSNEEGEKRLMKRMKKNDQVAIRVIGKKCHNEGNYETALEYLTKAAEVGDADSNHSLSCMYREGKGVEKDKRKEIYHLEKAAIGGHPEARHNLGYYEWKNGIFERAKKHFIIAANLGYEKSLKGIKELYAIGHASKEEYADALRAYQTAVEATKSSDREEAEEAIKNGRGRIKQKHF